MLGRGGNRNPARAHDVEAEVHQRARIEAAELEERERGENEQSARDLQLAHPSARRN